MTIALIYHSYSGITRRVAQQAQEACGGDLIEVVPRQAYHALTAYTVGCLRARNQVCDPIDPAEIDVSAYDLVVIGTPVWAFRPTPAINAAVAALKGTAGKPAIVFATCGGRPGETIPMLKQALAGRSARVVGEIVFLKGEDQDPGKVGELVGMIRRAAGQL